MPPGETKVVLDAQGPGVITHLWFTFFPPEKHEWAAEGSATNQDMLLRIFWDNRKKPGIEVPMGDFFGNAFGKRYEVASLPVAVGESGSYNCFWNMPFRKAAQIEVVNEGEKPISLLYYRTSIGSSTIRCPSNTVFPRPISAGISAGTRQGLRDSGHPKARAATWVRCFRCGRAARTGSARGTRRCSSTARKRRRSGARARRIISSRHGG